MNLRSRLGLVLICFLLGVSLVAQLRARRQSTLADVPSEDKSVILGNLVVANAALRNEVQKLQGEMQAYEQAQDRVVTPQMMEELTNLRIVNGSVEVWGPGVEVRVGSGVTTLDLQDVLNEIRNVGAEAISLNGRRLTLRAALSSDSRGTAIDGRSITPPYVFQAVGDPATMSTALNRRGGVLGLLQTTYPGLELEVKTVQRLVLPAAQAESLALARPTK